MSRVCVIGAGSWGTAFTRVLASSGHVEGIGLWCHSESTATALASRRENSRYLPGFTLPAQVEPTHDLARACADVDACVLAVPSTHLREVCGQLGEALSPQVPVIVLTKGIEPASGLLMSEVAGGVLGGEQRMAALSGPNHAEEVCRGLPSAAVLASQDLGLAERLRPLVNGPAFRVYASADIRGVEICGAYKNVIAVCCGICAAAGGGDNTLALIMTRGVAEMGRLVSAYGGDPMTCMGLAGMGDLVATCTSEHSRNRRFGRAFFLGSTLQSFEASSHMVVEGAHAVISICEQSQRLGVEAPLAQALYRVIHDGQSIDGMAEVLMGREPTEEFYGMGRRAS